MFYTYAIYNRFRDKIYIGYTAKLEERLKHHTGNWYLVYKENFLTRSDVIKREKELKSFRGREFIRSLIIKAS